jgi:ABC-type nickel/cobalt efflux system permease component RcnA
VDAVLGLPGALDFSSLFAPLEGADQWLTEQFAGASLLVALGIAFALGLRHASDPDHLVAVTSLVAADRDHGTRNATRLGAWWGLGHASSLLALGIPLIAFNSQLPGWLETGAEKGIGVIIISLAARVIWKWLRGDYRVSTHPHSQAAAPGRPRAAGHRHLHREQIPEHGHRPLRTPAQAFGIGTLHGLAGTGAIVVLILASLPTRLEAGLALAVFAPMSIVSMAACTTAFAWVLTRPIVEPLYRGALIPALGAFGLLFGLWYAGLA